jgi:hypothetical protein
MTRGLMAGITLVFTLLGSVCLGQEVPANHKPLEFLESLVGNWRVVTTEGDKVISDGQEASEWILNKSCMKHVGWSQFEGSPAEYMFYTGWNPKTEKIYQWAVGATDSVYAIITRTGTYDATKRLWVSEHQTVLSDGSQDTTLVKVRFINDDKLTIDFVERRQGDKVLPDHRDVFTRAEKAAGPPLDDKPGPAYEHLKFLDSTIGKWRVEGELPDGSKWSGEEVNQWVFDKNSSLTKGWCQLTGSDSRIEYELLTGWEPVKKKIVTMAIGSKGWSATREATYNPQNRCLNIEQSAVHSSGDAASADIKVQFLGDDRLELKFSNRIHAGESLPDFQLNATKISP